MLRSPVSFSWSSPEATEAFARALAPRLDAGDVIELEGGIGAGKTHFARALILARLAAPEDIPSPTFTLVQTYDSADGIEIWHADLYRLSHPDEAIELGFDEAFENAICLIEWPDRLADLRPTSALRLKLEASDVAGERLAVATWRDPRWAKKLEGLLP